MIDRSTNNQAALRSRQRGFLLNPFRFGPPPGADPYFLNVLLLLHFEGSQGGHAFLDSGPANRIASYTGVAYTDTTQYKFGVASCSFPTDGAVTFAHNDDFHFGSGDATVEFQMRPSTVSGTSVVVCKHFGNSGSWIVYRNGASLLLYVSSNGSAWDICNGISIGTLSSFAWHHVAWCRQGSQFVTFLNGSPGATATSSASVFAGTQPIGIGRNPQSGDAFVGFIDELRITKGIARYTGAFTPPTAPFPNF